jgi:integrase
MSEKVAAKGRGGRARTGTTEPAGFDADGKPRFRGRVRLGDGTKGERFDVPAGLDESQARAYVASFQAQEDALGLLLSRKREAERGKAAAEHKPHDGETCDAWHARFIPTLECGELHRRISTGAWKKWISPVIGSKAIRALTRDDVEDIRDRLDRALDAKEIRHSTARNVWGALTGALKAACSSRDRSLRVLSTALHYGVLPPKKGTSRERPWLYPVEWSALAACELVPLEYRQVYAIALYTGLRPGELRALTWGTDVDLDARAISISKALDAETGKIKAPKSARGQRIIPIHPNLVPMLEAMKGEAGTLVVPNLLAGNEHRFAEGFRAHLRAAGVNRARLSADNDTEEPVDFRSLRDSYATHLALTGIGDKVIQRRMGHASASTTDRYIKAAESLDVNAIGEPFPPLPRALSVRVGPAFGPTCEQFARMPQ